LFLTFTKAFEPFSSKFLLHAKKRRDKNNI